MTRTRRTALDGIDVPLDSATAAYLLAEPNLTESAAEWVGEGWQVTVTITPLMLAAALAKEADTQDADAAAGDSHPLYPAHLRQVAATIACLEAARLTEAANRAVYGEDVGKQIVRFNLRQGFDDWRRFIAEEVARINKADRHGKAGKTTRKKA